MWESANPPYSIRFACPTRHCTHKTYSIIQSYSFHTIPFFVFHCHVYLFLFFIFLRELLMSSTAQKGSRKKRGNERKKQILTNDLFSLKNTSEIYTAFYNCTCSITAKSKLKNLPKKVTHLSTKNLLTYQDIFVQSA